MLNTEFAEQATEAFAGIGIEMDPDTIFFKDEEWHGDIIACDTSNKLHLMATNSRYAYRQGAPDLEDKSGLNGLVVCKRGVLPLGHNSSTFVRIISTPHGLNAVMRDDLGFTPSVDCIERAFVPNYKQQKEEFTARQVTRGYTRGRQIIAPMDAELFTHDIAQDDVHERARQATSPAILQCMVVRAREIIGKDADAEELFSSGIDGWTTITTGLYRGMLQGRLVFRDFSSIDAEFDSSTPETVRAGLADSVSRGCLQTAVKVGVIPEGLHMDEQQEAYRALEENTAVHLADLFTRAELARPNTIISFEERARRLSSWQDVIKSYGDTKLAA